MDDAASWNSAYDGSPPWDIGRPQAEFVRLAEAGVLRGQVLDAGCGTGEHALLAATHGADATGVDIATRAIDRARVKAEERGITATFAVGDVLHLDRVGRRFDVVLDCGVFHLFDDEQRRMYVDSLRTALRPGGMYHMLCFSDAEPGDWGPRRVSMQELRDAFSDGWSIELIQPATLEITIDPNGARAWLASITRP